MAVPPKRKKSWNGSHRLLADLGVRRETTRIESTYGRGRRTNARALSVRQGARSSACSWDHSLGWAPRPKTKVKGKKFCAGEYFLGERSHLLGEGVSGVCAGVGD